MMLTRSLVAIALSFAAACAPAVAPGPQANPINAYRAYGEYHAEADDAALVAKAATADPRLVSVHVFQEALPPGIELTAGVFSVTAGYTHRLLGKYAYSTGKEEAKDDLVVAVKKMCVVTGANAAIILFQLIPNDHQDRAQAIEAVLVDLHERPN
jgi:hypothetical protein